MMFGAADVHSVVVERCCLGVWMVGDSFFVVARSERVVVMMVVVVVETDMKC